MPPDVGEMIGIELVGLEIPGLAEPLSLTVRIGHVRAVVSPSRPVSRAIADAVTGIVALPGQVSITGPSGGRIRLVPADGALLPHLTVLENIISTRRSARERHAAEVGQEVRAKAAGFGLDGMLDDYPHQIPVDRRRMTGLARALCARPDALVLEDDNEDPSTWAAWLTTPWRDHPGRAGEQGHDEPRTPDLLVGLATLLIVPTEERARPLDTCPLVLTPLVPSADDPGIRRRAG